MLAARHADYGLQHFPLKFIQSPRLVVILHEADTYRQIFLDGRELPRDPLPTWRGYSVGHWDQDNLVIETVGLNDNVWLDSERASGYPNAWANGAVPAA